MINQKIILSLLVLILFFTACENQIDNCINVECEENCEFINGECECEDVSDPCKDVVCDEHCVCVNGECVLNEDIFDRNTDSLALLALYKSTNGLGPDLNWDLHSPMNNWEGVKLNEEGRVISLSLCYEFIEGSLPSELCVLSKLTEFVFCSKAVQDGGFLDNIHKLQNLEHLTIAVTNMNRSIPPGFGKLKNLKYIEFSQSKLIGPIPSEIGNLENLETLTLGINSLDGPLPVELTKLTKLEDLHLGRNSLNIEIPIFLGEMTQLKSLSIDRAGLKGQIPIELWNLENLQFLDFTDNNLEGTLSSEISKMKSLNILKLTENKMSGELPSEIGTLSHISRIDLSDNDFSGPIPATLGENIKIKYLELRNNGLSGCIPTSFETYFCPTNLNPYTFNFSKNPELPWEGDKYKFCNNPNDQIGAPCKKDGEDGTIDEDCNCKI